VKRVAAAYVKPSNRTVGVFIPTDAPSRAPIPARPDLAVLLKDYRGDPAMAIGEPFDPSPANIDARTIRRTASSGMKLALLPKATRGRKVNAALMVHLGSEPDLTNRPVGIGVLTGSMLLRGTTTRSRQQIQDELDRLSARVFVSGMPAVATVSIETTREHLPAVLRLVADVLRHPAFPVTEFEQLRRQMVQALEAQRQQPGPAASLRLQRHLDPYPPGHPRRAATIDERIAAYRALTADDLKQFHREFYGAGASELAVVGDFDAAAIGDLADQLFAGWAALKPFVRMATLTHAPPPINETIVTPDKPNASFNARLNLSVRQDDPDYAALLLGNHMLGGDFNSRIVARLRQKEGLSYGAGSGLTVDVFDRAGTFSASAIAAPENIEKLERAFREELALALEHGFRPAELSTAKAGLLQTRQIDRAEDASLVATLRAYLFQGRTLDWDRQLDERIARVTASEVLAAMRKHLDPARLSVVKAGDFATVLP